MSSLFYIIQIRTPEHEPNKHRPKKVAYPADRYTVQEAIADAQLTEAKGGQVCEYLLTEVI